MTKENKNVYEARKSLRAQIKFFEVLLKSEENKNVYQAKKSLKAHIKFFEVLLKHINSNDEILKARSMWATWCLHRYINDGLIIDIEKAMKEHGSKETK